jgi:Uma2 family endonuclease
MSMPTLKRSWTAADLQDLPDDGNRYEVIDGELFVTPAPAWRHQEAAAGMYRLLHDYLKRERIAHAFVAPADIEFWSREGANASLDIDLTAYFAEVLDS